MRVKAGVDEAGRGPLAGPVVAAAVILGDHPALAAVNDSKKLSHKQRICLADLVIEHATAFFVASATQHEIDSLNILNATHLAMQRAVQGLSLCPDFVRVDGNRHPDFHWNDVPLLAESLIGGDALDRSIGAASIMAKVWRDQHMHNLDQQYPQYGFAKHKGYPTAAHVSALNEHGPCPEHRRSYKPVQRALNVRSAQR